MTFCAKIKISHYFSPETASLVASQAFSEPSLVASHALEDISVVASQTSLEVCFVACQVLSEVSTTLSPTLSQVLAVPEQQNLQQPPYSHYLRTGFEKTEISDSFI